jgi:hypothetical protein
LQSKVSADFIGWKKKEKRKKKRKVIASLVMSYQLTRLIQRFERQSIVHFQDGN